MAHWTEKYVGRKWTPDFDCLALARLVADEEFGNYIRVPDNLRWKDMSAAAAADIAEEYAMEIPCPEEGDAVLMKVIGNRRSLGSHVGVYVWHRRNPWVLHNLQRMGVLFQPESQLKRVQLEVVGYYRWLSRGGWGYLNERR